MLQICSIQDRFFFIFVKTQGTTGCVLALRQTEDLSRVYLASCPKTAGIGCVTLKNERERMDGWMALKTLDMNKV